MIDYQTNFVNTNAVAFPGTLAINVTAPGAGDGTEFVKLMVDDIWGRTQAIMDYAGLTPDDVTEAPDTAQILEALNKGWAIGPGMGVVYWKEGSPAANGDRVLLLQGQVILIASYPLLAAACYIGDADNADTDYTGFYKTSDAGGVTRSTSGAYMVLPDARGLSLKNIGDAVVNTRTKTGPVKLTELQEDQSQGHWHQLQIGGGTGVYVSDAGTGATVSGRGIGDGSVVTEEIVESTDPVDDGTNGTPRDGLNTRDSVLATNFGITY